MSPYEYFKEIEHPVARIFAQMSSRGIVVDLEYLRELRQTLEEQKKPIEEEICNELGKINLNSPKRLLGALNEKGIYPNLKGKPSTDKRALEYHKSNSVVSRLLSYSQLDTLLSSFVYPYLERNQAILHQLFNQTGT